VITWWILGNYLVDIGSLPGGYWDITWCILGHYLVDIGNAGGLAEILALLGQQLLHCYLL